VKAPGGSAHLEVRRSARVSSRLKSTQGLSPAPVLVRAPLGVKPSVGYKYQVLQVVPENGDGIGGQPSVPGDFSEIAGDFRDTITAQGGPQQRHCASSFLARPTLNNERAKPETDYEA
jgi:hypothetical protein